jgi:hypothetical protein
MINLNNIKYLKRPKDTILFIKTFFSLIVIKVLLYLIKLPKLLKLLDPEKKVPPDDSKIEYILKFTNFILFRLFRSSNPCLLRSILLFRQLRMSGREVKIVFGVKNEEEKLKGHAWLIVEGKHFPEPNDPSGEYQITFVYP